jgi:predicted nucleic acid-binding protein
VLDSEALAALAGKASARKREVRAALTVAARLGQEVVVPTLVLAELYRGRGHSALIDACLSRETGLLMRDTDRTLARLVGGVLTGAKQDSAQIVDAHVVAVAVERGGGVLLTGDVADLERLAAPYRSVRAHSIA